VNYQTFMLMK